MVSLSVYVILLNFFANNFLNYESDQAGYIEVLKEFVGRRPRTTLKLTQVGHKAIKAYREKMRSLLDQTGN